MITKRHFSLGLFATGLVSMVPGAWQSAQSQAGSRGARIIVGFGPGGALDVVARLLITAMKDYASPFIVENRPGASERIALEAVKSSAADGTAHCPNLVFRIGSTMVHIEQRAHEGMSEID